MDGVDVNELIKRAVKYLVEGIMVALAAYAIPKKSLNLDEVLLIALSVATLSILDTYAYYNWFTRSVFGLVLVLTLSDSQDK